MNKLTNLKHYKKVYVKALYGRYGKTSGLNPGVLWPRKEELDHIKMYEKAFQPSLEDLVAEDRKKKLEVATKRQQREKDVYDRMQKLPAAMKEFFDQVEDKKREKDEWILERETLVEEIREFLGYKAKPSDPRFQEAIAKKEAEEIKRKKKEAKLARENASLEELLGTKKP